MSIALFLVAFLLFTVAIDWKINKKKSPYIKKGQYIQRRADLSAIRIPTDRAAQEKALVIHTPTTEELAGIVISDIYRMFSTTEERVAAINLYMEMSLKGVSVDRALSYLEINKFVINKKK